MEKVVIAVLLVILLAVWMISVRQKLAAMNENINNAMNQIGVQLAVCFDMLESLMELTGVYAAGERETLEKLAAEGRCEITAKSTPEEVLGQEKIIAETMELLSAVADRNSGLKVAEDYKKYMEAVRCYEKMVHTSSLIYDDFVGKLNGSIERFPASLIAGLLGFRQRGYLGALEKEDNTNKSE